MDIVFLIAVIQAVLASSWRLATPIIYASIGEIFTERSGVLNIGLEGVMLMGAFAGFAGTFYTGSLILGLLVAMLSGVLSGLLFAIFTVTIKANQIVVGAALNLIGLGLTGFLYRTLFAGQSLAISQWFPSIKSAMVLLSSFSKRTATPENPTNSDNFAKQSIGYEP